MGGDGNIGGGDRGVSKQRGRSSPRMVEELVQRVDMSAHHSCGRSGRVVGRNSNPLLRRALGQLKRMKTRRWEVVTGERKGMTMQAHMSLSGGKGSQRGIFGYMKIQ